MQILNTISLWFFSDFYPLPRQSSLILFSPSLFPIFSLRSCFCFSLFLLYFLPFFCQIAWSITHCLDATAVSHGRRRKPACNWRRYSKTAGALSQLGHYLVSFWAIFSLFWEYYSGQILGKVLEHFLSQIMVFSIYELLNYGRNN